MSRSTRTRVIFQTQETLPDKFSFCGLYSVNNALQRRDFLTPIEMRRVLKRLKKVEADVDHGHERFGAYTTQALHLALQKKGRQLRFLNRQLRQLEGFKAKDKSKRAGLITGTEEAALLVIGRRPGQLDGTWHCIARAKVGNRLVFIDPDEYHVFPNTQALLADYFQVIDGVYAIEDIVSHRVKPNKPLE